MTQKHQVQRSTTKFLLAALLLLIAWTARADQYRGNGDSGFGGAIGNGTLTLTDDGTNISGTLTPGGSINDVLVLYIQSGPGGFADTSGFSDQGDACRQAISGVSASGRSALTFASGFQPNYAIALAPAAAGTGGLYQLANGTNNSSVYLGSVNVAPLNNTGPYTFSFPAALIGMIPGVRSTIQLFGTYISTNGYRSTEAIAGNLTGAQGWNPFTLTAYAVYTFDADAVLIKLPIGVWTQRTSANAPSARYAFTAVWTGNEMIIWGGNPGVSPYYLNDGGRYNPAANTWAPLPTDGAPTGRYWHTAVWTGTEMIVWGGHGSSGCLNDGGRYNPAANSWMPLPTNSAPAARYLHTAVWTGTEMIVWGGEYWNGTSWVYFNDGGRYNPVGDNWTAMATADGPAGRSGHTAVWTSNEMIIWGGSNDSSSAQTGSFLADGGRYNPVADSWTAVLTNGAPAARAYHTMVWTGSEMIVWGGYGAKTYLNDGGRYNPAANGWTAILSTVANTPAARNGHTAVWTGSEMIVWGGIKGSTCFNDGGRYNPVCNSWTAIPGTGAPAARYVNTTVWTGSEMILFGGIGNSGYLSDTWSYYPYAPAVRISRFSPASADIAWPLWSSALRLYWTTDLAAGQWTAVTNEPTRVGSENRVTVSPLSDRQFFRAEYP